jgi:hypothetical protein
MREIPTITYQDFFILGACGCRRDGGDTGTADVRVGTP